MYRFQQQNIFMDASHPGDSYPPFRMKEAALNLANSMAGIMLHSKYYQGHLWFQNICLKYEQEIFYLNFGGGNTVLDYGWPCPRVTTKTCGSQVHTFTYLCTMIPTVTSGAFILPKDVYTAKAWNLAGRPNSSYIGGKFKKCSHLVRVTELSVFQWNENLWLDVYMDQLHGFEYCFGRAWVPLSEFYRPIGKSIYIRK